MAAEMEHMHAETDRLSVDSETCSSDDAVERSTWTARRIGNLAFRLTGLVACGVITAVALHHPGHKAEDVMITARELLESDDMVKVLAKNQVDILNLKADEKEVQMNVAKGIKKIEDGIQADMPAMWRELNELKLAPQHNDAMLRIVSSFRDPRVQEIGYKVAKACSDGRSEGRKGVTRHLKEVFNKDELPKMRQLKNELFHGLHQEAQEGSAITFDVDSIRFLKGFPDGLGSQEKVAEDERLLRRRLALDELQLNQKSSESSDDTSVADPGSMGSVPQMIGDSQTVEEALDFFGGIEEQTRVLLDQIDFVGASFGWDAKVPSEAKSGVALSDFLTNVADCVARADGNDVKEEMCPFKFGSAAFDAIACLDNMAGVSNARLGLDNPGGYDVWDELLGTPAPAGAYAGVAPGPAPNNDFLNQFFSNPTPAPASGTANANQAFSWS